MTQQNADLRSRGAQPPDKKATDSAERRQHRRFPVSATAEMVEVLSQTHLTGRASDLGQGGCYIDTVTPLPVGTAVALTLICEGHKIQAKASVIYAHTGMGMGLAFMELTADQWANLGAWLGELSGESSNQPRASEISVDPSSPSRIEERIAERHAGNGTGVREAFQQLLSVLRNRGVLTETDVEDLAEMIGR